MILHCKNALSFLHFYSVKSYNFCYFFLIFNYYYFLIWQFFTSEKIKKSEIFFFFFLKCKNLGRRIRKPRNKKKNRLMWKADHDGGVKASYVEQGVQRRMVKVVNFFVFLRL